MTRPWHIWAAFGLCLIIVLAAMGWTSLTVLRLEEQSRTQAVREENVRLALWRMDSSLAPLLAQETAIPYFAYGSFYPAGRAYGEMFNGARNGEALLASPLLTETGPHAILYFQFDPDGQIASPQVPPKTKMNLAQSICATPEQVSAAADRMRELKAQVSRDTLLAMLPEEKTPAEPSVAFINAVDNLKPDVKDSKEQNDANSKEPQTKDNNDQQQAESKDNFKGRNRAQSGGYGENKSSAEWQSRKRSYDEAQAFAGNSNLNAPQQIQLANPPANQSKALSYRTETLPNVTQGMMKPVWVGKALVLARRVSVGGKVYVQGCWLDWPWLQERLLSDVRDLLPDASLEPASAGSAAGERAANMLAALPANLMPGTIVPLDPPETLSPVRLSLLVAWSFALLAAGAVASLLFGAVSLSERRGAFVSAVTHELRTPLTTFRMYAEMLAGGMVPSEEARQSYLNTLSAEAGRLSHLVENVLAYARLERNSARSRVERVDLCHLFDAVKTRLSERALQAGMTLHIDVDKDCAAASLTTDVSAVEQILFNLVDNACKYAAASERKEIRITGGCSGKWARIEVRDSGPGFSNQEVRRLFQPFSKSARQAAHSAPGVGLGLALSKRLARDLNGDLKLNRSVKDGACFELTLPTG